MGTAHLEISMQEKDVSADGADKIELMFSANEGEPPRPLSKIASGGELSRFALAAKTVLAGKEGGGVMIFDEVDAGIGGETAITLGAKLAALSRTYQVIVITHLAQVAAFASSQFSIRKRTEGGRTIAEIQSLDADGRVREIARMLSGDMNAVNAKRTAEDLLSLAGAAH